MRLLAVVLAFASLCASADVILDPRAVSQMLAEIAKLQEDSRKAPSRAARLDALYDMGAKVLDLTGRMTNDLAVHGTNDAQLVSRIISRLGEYGIVVKRDGQEYLYDMAAFREYVRLAPQGKRAADARFALAGFADPGDDPARLRRAIAEKERFLHDFPKYKDISLLKLLLAQDHAHLSRVYAKSDKAASAREDATARKMFQEIIRLYPNSEEAKSAAANLALGKR